jgi:hypothetical protein
MVSIMHALLRGSYFKEARMRFVGALTVAVACALTIAVNAQDVKTKTEVKGDSGKAVTYSGCVRTGVEERSFVLDKVVPIGQTTDVTTSGNVTTTTTRTSYLLVPGETVTLQQFVGRKVEVTGVMVPAGESKTETKTKIDREHAPDVTIKEKSKSDSDLPQFRVTSVKHLADSCS